MCNAHAGLGTVGDEGRVRGEVPVSGASVLCNGSLPAVAVGESNIPESDFFSLPVGKSNFRRSIVTFSEVKIFHWVSAKVSKTRHVKLRSGKSTLK